MLEFVLNTEIKNAVKSIYGSDNVIFDVFNLYVYQPSIRKTFANSVLYLINEEIDVPTTARVIIRSKTNILITSKDSYNPNLNIKPYRDYIEIITENYGTEFVPFTLTFLKISPYGLPQRNSSYSRTAN